MKYIIVFDTEISEAWSVLPDSVGLINDRPLFVPDLDGGAVGYAAVAVKITRLGKCIEERFAHRYHTEYAPALIVMPSSAAQMLENGVLPSVSELCFDSAVVTGRWTVHETDKCDIPRYDFTHYDTPVTIDTSVINRSIENVSQLNTLKTGDILIFPVKTPFNLIENDIITAHTQHREYQYMLRTKIK